MEQFKDKIRNSSNTNTIFDKRDYILYSDVKEVVSDYLSGLLGYELIVYDSIHPFDRIHSSVHYTKKQAYKSLINLKYNECLSKRNEDLMIGRYEGKGYKFQSDYIGWRVLELKI